MLRKTFAWCLCGALFLLGLAGCVESRFELAQQSRLPSWFDVPTGLQRDDLKVTLEYHTDGSAVFRLYRKDNSAMLQEAVGQTRGDGPTELKNPPPGSPKHYPMYQVVTVGGKAEAIEHRKMEPIFYVTDDQRILRELGM